MRTNPKLWSDEFEIFDDPDLVITFEDDYHHSQPRPPASVRTKSVAELPRPVQPSLL